MNNQQKSVATVVVMKSVPLAALTTTAINPYAGKTFYDAEYKALGPNAKLWANAELMAIDAKSLGAKLPYSYDEWLSRWIGGSPLPTAPVVGAHLFWALAKVGKPINSIGWPDDALWRLLPNAGIMGIAMYHANNDKRVLVSELPAALNNLREVFLKIRFSTKASLNQGEGSYVVEK